jgi:putative ABC transport system permease protein
VYFVALRMLIGDRGKYISLVFGLSFAALLIAQQGAIFLGLMLRATGPLQNVGQADLWIGDAKTRYIGEIRPLSDSDIMRVRSVPGIQWAEPFFASRAVADLPDRFQSVQIIGIDRSTLIGQPPEMTVGSLNDLRIPDAVIVEEAARPKLDNIQIGGTLRLNDQRAVVVGFCRAKAGFESNALIYTAYENAIRFVPLGRNQMSFILAKVKPGADIKQVAAEVNTLRDLGAFTREQMRNRTVGFIMTETGIGINFGITVLLGFVVGLVLSASIFYQFTVENLKNFAVLKATGARTRTLIRMILLQATTVGLIGYGVGVGGAAIFALASRKPGVELAAYFPWQLLVIALGANLLCVSLGSVISLRRVIMLEPAIVFK